MDGLCHIDRILSKAPFIISVSINSKLTYRDRYTSVCCSQSIIINWCIHFVTFMTFVVLTWKTSMTFVVIWRLWLMLRLFEICRAEMTTPSVVTFFTFVEPTGGNFQISSSSGYVIILIIQTYMVMIYCNLHVCYYYLLNCYAVISIHWREPCQQQNISNSNLQNVHNVLQDEWPLPFPSKEQSQLIRQWTTFRHHRLESQQEREKRRQFCVMFV